MNHAVPQSHRLSRSLGRDLWGATGVDRRTTAGPKSGETERVCLDRSCRTPTIRCAQQILAELEEVETDSSQRDRSLPVVSS